MDVDASYELVLTRHAKNDSVLVQVLGMCSNSYDCARYSEVNLTLIVLQLALVILSGDSFDARSICHSTDFAERPQF